MDLKAFLQINCLGENNKDSWEKSLSTLESHSWYVMGENKGMN